MPLTISIGFDANLHCYSIILIGAEQGVVNITRGSGDFQLLS